mgnify:CR=1 FL=1
MKKLLIAVLCLMLTGCAAPAPSDGSGPDRSVSPDIPAPSPAASSAPNGESGPPQASPETDPETAENPSASQEPSESSLGPQNQEQIIQELLSAMTLEEKVGQMFFVRCPETGGAELAAQYKVGGYLLFGRDFKDKTAQQVRDDIQSYQDASGIPLLIGTDEEGGTVVRVSANPNLRSTRFSSPQKLYAEGGLDRIRSDTEEKDALLLSLGINVNLAPVCDISSDSSSFIYPRTLGQDAETTSDYIRTVVGQMKSDGIGMVLKHFPGYGGSADTHTGQALDPRPLSDFEKNDLLPFEAGIDAGAQAVLVSHNIVACLDADYPASLSPAVHALLRDRLGFDGVIMTDDLAMQAVTDFTGNENAAVLAVQAGNDLIISSDFVTQYHAVLDAVKNGTLRKNDIEQAAQRVILWKIQLGLISF